MATRIALEEHTAALLAKLASATSLTPSAIVNRLLAGHLPELFELDEFLETHPAGSPVHDEAVNLLVSHGPESVMAGIRRIAPDYMTLGQRFEQKLAELLPMRESRARGL